MSKGNEAKEKTGGVSQDEQRPEGAARRPLEGSTSSSRSKGHDPLSGHCFAVSCKSKSQKLDFCDLHFEHFKFGLITKTGQPVSDYEKKIEHFLAFQKKRGARKVA